MMPDLPSAERIREIRVKLDSVAYDRLPYTMARDLLALLDAMAEAVNAYHVAEAKHESLVGWGYATMDEHNAAVDELTRLREASLALARRARGEG